MERGRAKRILIWLAFALTCSFAVYRIAAFTPQPLDGPATLRPLLNAWFVGFIQLFRYPETAYLTWRLAGLATILTVSALALLNYSRRQAPLAGFKRVLYSRSLLFFSIALSLLVCRFPTLLDYQLNPDEGEFLSAAHKLFYNGNFFQSVDCGTSGPLNIYPLMLPAVLGISPDYASSRLLILAISFSVICLLYGTFHQLSSDRVARVAMLPAALVFAGLEQPNLIHYSSEQTPLLIIAAAIYLSVRLRCRPERSGAVCFMLGLLTGCAFFSKMQSVPIVAVLAVGGILFSRIRRIRAILMFLAGLSCLLIVNTAMCLAGGVLGDFWISYIVSNQRYVNLGGDPFLRFAGFLVKTSEIRFLVFTFLSFAAALTIQKFLKRSQLLALTVSVTIALFGTYFSSQLEVTATDSIAGILLMSAVASFPFLILIYRVRESNPLSWATLLSFAAAASALYCIYKPHRLFPHYLLLLVPTLSFVTGLLVIRLVRTQSVTGVVLFVIGIGAANQAYLWASPLFKPGYNSAFRNVLPTIRPPDGNFIRALTRPTDRIFVWGWTPDPYLGSGRVSATRDLNLFYEFSGNAEISAYYQDRLARDLRKNPPALFIDAVGPASWVARDPKQFGFGQFPELMWFVRTNYFQLPDAYGQHYYLRSDLADRVNAVPKPKRCNASALRCLDFPERTYIFEAALVSSVAFLPPIQLPTQARIEIDVTPMAREAKNATIFGNGVPGQDYRGFRFESAGDDRYRLLVGLGDQWAASKPVRLPYGRSSSLQIVFEKRHISIQVDGAVADETNLLSPMAHSEGPITVGSGIGENSRFTGLISFFEIR